MRWSEAGSASARGLGEEREERRRICARGDLIVARCGSLARIHVVRVTGNVADDAKPWRKQIEFVLMDPKAAFERASRRSLGARVTSRRARELLGVRVHDDHV